MAAAAVRALLSRSRARAFFPVLARIDELDRRFDSIAARIDALAEQQAGLARLLEDIHVEAVRQQGRLGAVEERSAALLAEHAVDARRLQELSRLLS